MGSKRIGTFKQFLKQKLNEGNVSIECDFWDEAQGRIMDLLSQQCQGCLSWEALVKYVKNKNQILGKDDPGYDEALLLQHIKDLIFQLYGDSLYTSALCDWGENNSEIQAKGLVVSELAKVIFEKVNDTRKSPDDPVPGTISLIDKDKAMGQDEDEYYEDFPYESHKVRPVKKFYDYTKLLKEAVAFMDCPDHDACIDYCIKRIKKEAGNLDPEAILQVAQDAASPQIKARLVSLYVRPMVMDYLSQNGVKVVSREDECPVPEDIINDGIEALCDGLADEVLVKIANENGMYYEEV